MREKPEVFEDIEEGGRHLVRKWGPRDVLVLLNPQDHRKISDYVNQETDREGAPPEDRKTFSFKFEAVKGLSRGDFILSVEEDGSDRGLIEV